MRGRGQAYLFHHVCAQIHLCGEDDELLVQTNRLVARVVIGTAV